MRFNLEDVPKEVVFEKRKYANFTVKDIGGPAEIEKWRRIQLAKQEAYKIKLRERDQRIASFEAESGQKLDRPTIHTTSWAEKQMFVEAERAEIKRAKEAVVSYPPWEMTPEPKKTVLQRIVLWIKKVWMTANF